MTKRPRTYYRDFAGQLWLRDPDNQPVKAVVSQDRVVPESCWICGGDCSAAPSPPLACPVTMAPEYLG